MREDTVFISGLPSDTDHDQIKTYFGVVGKIKVRINTVLYKEVDNSKTLKIPSEIIHVQYAL